MERTFTREHPTTGETQTRVVDTPRDAVQLAFDGWVEVGKERPAKKTAPRKAVKKGAPPARELNDTE